MTDIHDTLNERGKQYGSFLNNANIAQRLKTIVRAYRPELIIDDEIEAMEMICVKLSRLLNGNPHHVDSWRDIAGYATLVADRLEGDAK